MSLKRHFCKQPGCPGHLNSFEFCQPLTSAQYFCGDPNCPGHPMPSCYDLKRHRERQKDGLNARLF